MKNVCKASPAHLSIAQSHNCCPTGASASRPVLLALQRYGHFPEKQVVNKLNEQEYRKI